MRGDGGGLYGGLHGGLYHGGAGGWRIVLHGGLYGELRSAGGWWWIYGKMEVIKKDKLNRESSSIRTANTSV